MWECEFTAAIFRYFISKENESCPVKADAEEGVLNLWGVDGSLMLVQCYHAMLTLGKSLPSHQRSFLLLWKKVLYFRLATILISCWAFKKPGNFVTKKPVLKNNLCSFFFSCYHNWSSLIKLLQKFISDTKEVQVHLS